MSTFLSITLLVVLQSPASTANPPVSDTEHADSRAQPPREAAAGFRVPAGFRVDVFAAEPDVRNPVAMAWDGRGRLWVAENFTYSDMSDKFDLRQRDRVLIFEDRDRDGRFDVRKVFSDELQRLGSVELGLGGVWALCPPQLLFLPDRNRDDVPDGPAEVVLDGFQFANENHHTFANGLKWGPDGWLYGRCGASSPGEVGLPGTPPDQRIPLRGGLWRYHPGRKHFEVLAHGTTNPWGHDWNALGEAFFINTVNGHLWHLIPGAHFVRPHTIEPAPRAYALIDQHADHYHWDNARTMTYPWKPNADDSRLGGGHAHSGLMIYQSDQWPESYRGRVYTLNFHGRRMNRDRLERDGSGYVGRHEPDLMFASDPWFRGIDLSQGPDGSVYVLDWSDTGECHEHDGVHRSSGRIYRVSWGKPGPSKPINVQELDLDALVALQRHPNDWYARQGRRELVDRQARGEDVNLASRRLQGMLSETGDPVLQLRALWTLYSLHSVERDRLNALLDDRNESIRAWSIRLLTDDLPMDTIFSRRGGADVPAPLDLLGRFSAMARTDSSGLVRLVLASTLQRLPVAQRETLAGALASRAEDAGDHNIPALLWTALIPVADVDPSALVRVATVSRSPLLDRWIARCLGEDLETRPSPLTGLLEAARDYPADARVQVVTGLSEALAGWHRARRPAGWEAFRQAVEGTKDVATRERIRDLDVLFGSGRALEAVRRLALDEAAPIESRKSALRSLIASRSPDLRTVCETLLRVRFLNSVAVQGLVLFDDPALGRSIASNYRLFHPSERRAAMAALVSRPTFAMALLEFVEAGKMPRQELSAFDVRQIRSLGDPRLDERLARVWGAHRETSADRKVRIAALKQKLDPGVLSAADRGRGRSVFDRICASCHRLHGHGGDVGPDLTGTGRDNLDYLLENVLDPSASVSADFRMTVVAMADGRVLNGLVRGQTDRTLTLQSQTEKLVLDRGDVEALRPSDQSLMPEGLLEPLSAAEVRDLLAYLMHRTQVPLPAR